MAIEFENPVTAGTVLVREAIQSGNYDPGTAGWRIRRDGEAEFSDLTVRSSDGSDSTVTVENGRITIEDGADVERIVIDSDGYRFYDSSGNLLADLRQEATVNSLAGLYTRNFAVPENTYAFFGGAQIVFGPVDNTEADHHGTIQYVLDPDDYTAITITTGEQDQDLDEQARVQLVSERGQVPRVWVDGGTAAKPADLQVTGGVYGVNVPYFVRKTSTTTITNDATFSNDPDLWVNLEAGKFYHVEFFINYGTTANAGFSTDWNVPTGATGNRGINGAGQSFSGTNADNAGGRYGVHNFSTRVDYGDRNDPDLYLVAHETAMVYSGDGGTLGLRWRQEVSHSDRTVVSDGSWLKVTEVPT